MPEEPPKIALNEPVLSFDERRMRPRDVPQTCKVRLCRPSGFFCPDCGRKVLPSLFEYYSRPPIL
jgi:hypothetical protein